VDGPVTMKALYKGNAMRYSGNASNDDSASDSDIGGGG
jgi:hypothetical protein